MNVEIVSTHPPTAATGCVVLCSNDEPWWAGAAHALDVEGFLVGRVAGVEAAAAPAVLAVADVLVLDLIGTADGGVDLCDRIRNASDVAVLAVGDHVGDEVADVLAAGADGYARRSRSARELAARVRTLHRRVGTLARPWSDGGSVDAQALTPDPIERAVLGALLRHLGRVVSRPALLQAGLLPIDDPAALDPVVRRLRGRIALGGAGLRIVAVRGVGFRCDIVG